MSERPETFEEWRAHHYRVESDYARRIVRSPKGSEERDRLIDEAYSHVIGEIIQQYDPDMGETRYTKAVAEIVRVLLPEGGRVFDVGCGGGNLISALIQAGYDARGIDISRDCIVRARKKLEPLDAAGVVEHADILSYPLDDEFDCVVMDNVIEHIVPDSIGDVLGKCYDVLNRRGYIVVITPHRFAGPHDVSRYFLPLGATAEGFHLREFSFMDLSEELKGAGFQKVLGFPIHPWLLWRARLPLRPTLWAARRARRMERWLGKPPWSGFLRIDRMLTRAVVALAFPAVAVGVKEG